MFYVPNTHIVLLLLLVPRQYHYRAYGFCVDYSTLVFTFGTLPIALKSISALRGLFYTLLWYVANTVTEHTCSSWSVLLVYLPLVHWQQKGRH